jgi:hypothetical protein
MKTSKTNPDDKMRAEYDFSKAVRGKNYKPLHKGYAVHIHQEDGVTVVNNYSLIDGTIMLEPDVRAYFPDSEAVNTALRSLIQIAQQVPAKTKPYKQKNSISHKVAEGKK